MSDARESSFDDLEAISGAMGEATNGHKDTPPRPTTGSTRPRATPPKAAPPTSSRWALQLEKKLYQFFITVSAFVSMFNEYDSKVLEENAESLAHNWMALAEENPKVRRALEAMLETNAWGGALIATAAVAIPIMGNHGYIPARLAGIFTLASFAASDTGSAADPVE